MIKSNPEVRELSVPYNEMAAIEIKKIGKGAMALKGARAREDITQKELAKKLNIDQKLISKIKNGQSRINAILAKKIGNMFNIDYRVFLQ